MSWQERVGARLAAMQQAPAVRPSAAVERGGAGLAAQASPAAGVGAALDHNPFAEALRLLEPVSARLARLESRRAAVDASYTDEGLIALENWMRQHGVTDYQAAMPLFEKAHPRPPMVEGGSRHFPDQRPTARADPGFEMLLKGDQEGFLRHQIPLAIAEVRGTR